MLAAKNSRKRIEARSPAAATSAGNTGELNGTRPSWHCLRQRPLAQIMGDHDKITVRVQHEDFALSSLPIADLTPDLTRPRIKGPAGAFERPFYRFRCWRSRPGTSRRVRRGDRVVRSPIS